MINNRNIWIHRADMRRFEARHDLRMAREWRRRYRQALKSGTWNFALLAYNTRIRHLEDCKQLLAEARAFLIYAELGTGCAPHLLYPPNYPAD